MSNDRKAVILGRLRRFTTVTPRPRASGPFRPLRSGRCPRSLDACTASRPPAGTGSRVCPSYQCVARIAHETPVPQPDTSKCFTRVHRVNALPSRDETALRSLSSASGWGHTCPALRSASLHPEPFGSEPFSDPARPHAGPRSPLPHPSGHRTGTHRRRTRVGGGAVAGRAGANVLGRRAEGAERCLPREPRELRGEERPGRCPGRDRGAGEGRRGQERPAALRSGGSGFGDKSG